MRTKNSIINSIVSLCSYALLFFGPFFVTPALAILGENIVGIQKTFADIVSLLNVVELGISFGIIYKLYKPIAEENFKKVAILLNFYKDAFKIVSCIIFILGLITAFFIPVIVPAAYISGIISDLWLSSVFMLYVFDTIAAYLFGHKRAMLIADQKNYVVNICRTICQLLMFILQIAVIYIFKSFSLYVIVKLSFTILESLIIHFQYKKKYLYIDLKTKDKLLKWEKTDLFKNLGALFYHKVGYQSLTSFSTVIMTNKLGEAVTGMYYPYAVITSGLMRVTDQIFSSVLSSFGNLLAIATKIEVFNVYKKIYFLNHLIFSFFSVSLFCLLAPFISLWMGSSYVFPLSTILLITLNLYVLGMRQSITMVKNSAGLYRPDRYFALLESLINIVLAFYLVQRLGLNGILWANLISSILIPFWTQPYIVYSNVFNRPVISYYKKYAIYFLITIVSGFITFCCCSLFDFSGFFKITVNAIICMIVPNAINIIIFYSTDEFKYLLRIVKSVITKITHKKEAE